MFGLSQDVETPMRGQKRTSGIASESGEHNEINVYIARKSVLRNVDGDASLTVIKNT